MYNLRYHLASLVAVFLALAVGLLLGTLVAERGTIGEQVSALAANLQAEYDRVSAANNELQARVERDDAFTQDAVGPLTANALVGSNVMVVVGAGRTNGLQTTVEAVRFAGGTVSTATLREAALALDTAVPDAVVAYFAASGLPAPAPGPELIDRVAQTLAAEWGAAGARPLTDALVAAGLLSTDDFPAELVATSLVVLGDGTGAADGFSLALARAFGARGAVALGADSTVLEGGPAAACASAGLGAIDHLGTPQGRVSLVYLLSGRAHGYYGYGAGAQAAYPQLVL